MNTILGYRHDDHQHQHQHHRQAARNMNCTSHGNFHGKRKLQSFNHRLPDTPLQKRSRTRYHYTTTTTINQQYPMQQNPSPVAPQNPSHVEQSLGQPSRVPAFPALPLQNPDLVLPPGTQTKVDMNMTSSLLGELITAAENNQPLQAMSLSPKTLPQGLVSSSKQLIVSAPSDSRDDSIGLEFDHAKLKVRHESVIRSLYADLPRQCVTCGLRFKAQEEHSHHMDWHVRKNRVAKSKLKQMQTRKLFPSSSLLLKDSEANAKSNGGASAFLATSTVEEENNFEELLAVFADEEQKECPLCTEAFDEYFSDETNDWMYRGAVYMNKSKASTRRLYKSLVGRIVHAKCLYTKEEMPSWSVLS